MKTKFTILLISVVFFIYTTDAQTLTVLPCQTEQEVIDLVDSMLLGNIVSEYKTNIAFTGDPQAVGYYTNGYILGFENSTGMVMTTGLADLVDEANVCNSDANARVDNNGIEEEPDLALLGNGSVHDACIVEFDVYFTADSMSLNYVFASEEYHDYVTSYFNDVFGFFLSGTGISGNYSNSADLLNIVPPDVAQFVSVHSVNFGEGGKTCTGKPLGCNNCQYLIDNSQQTDPGFGQIVYDAYTIPMQGTHYVTPKNWYHVKLSISDIGDAVFDSGVFLEKNFLLQYYATSNHAVGNKAFRVYPIPAKEVLHIEFPVNDQHRIVLKNMQGRVVTDQTTSVEKYSLPVKNIPQGLYLLKISGKDFVKQIKIVIE